MSDIIYTEFDDKEVREFLNKIDSRLKNIKGGKKEYTGLLSAIVYGDITRHFEQEQGSEGPWKKWSKSYQDAIDGKVAFRKKNGKLIAFDPSNTGIKPPRKPGNILQDTGRLRQNFKPSKVRRVNQGFLWFNDAQTKSGFPYAAAHDVGGPQLPKRDFMWLSEDAMEKIEAQTLQFILEKGI